MSLKLPSTENSASTSSYRDLGLLNGLLIGLTLSIGAWALEIITRADLPVPLQYPSLVLSIILLITLNGFTGWLTIRIEKALLVALIWFVSAILTTVVISYQPYFGRTLTIWLLDRRFWGLPVYPNAYSFTPITFFAGFFIILLLGFLGLVQNYRLKTVHSELDSNHKMTAKVWALLLLPLPFIYATGLVTRDIVGDPSETAVQIVHQTIQRGRTYSGDLFELSLADGINYSAIQNVREQMSPNYSLTVGVIDPQSSTTIIVAHFDNGAWINCRLTNNQLAFCYDAAPPYTLGLKSLITGEAIPENCRNCLPHVSNTWHEWLRSQGSRLGNAPKIEREAQWGSYVLMRIESDRAAIECWFNEIDPVVLESCEEVKN